MSTQPTRILKMVSILCFGLCAFLSCAQPANPVLIQQADSLLALSRKYTGERKFDEALQAGDAAQKIAEEAAGRESAAYAATLFNLGQIFYLKGNYEKAQPLFQDAKTIQSKVLENDHPDFAATLNSLGNIYWQMARYQEAEPYYLKVREIREKQPGKNHPDYAAILNSLGLLYRQMGRYELAEKYYLEAKGIREKNSGKIHADYAASLNNLGTLYWKMGRYPEAEQYYLEAKDIREKVSGKTHSSYAGSLTNLANFYRDIGRYEAAEPLLTEAQIILEKQWGIEHPNYAVGLHSLADLFATMGRYEEAEKLYLKAKDIREKHLGKENPGLISILNNLALVYIKTGRYEEAEPLYLEVKRMWGNGENPANYAAGLSNLALLYMKMGSYAKAESLYVEARDIRGEQLGKEHPAYAASLNSLGMLYVQMERYEEAGQYYTEARAIREKVLGKRHPDYVESLVNQGIFHWKTGRYPEAAGLLEEANARSISLLSTSSRFLSNRELAAYAQLFTNSLGEHYSFAQVTGGALSDFAASCYDNALFYKGFLLNVSSSISRLSAADTGATRLTNLLKSLHLRLANEYAKPIADRFGVDSLETEANRIEKELVQAVAGFGDAIRQVTWKDVQAALRPGEAAIEFIHYSYYTPEPTDSVRYGALVVRKNDARPFFLPLFEERRLARLLPESNDPDRIDASYQSMSISGLVWKPLDSLLQGISTVYCAPSGLLHRLNMGALPVGAGQIFTDRHELVVLGSTRQLALSDPNDHRTKTAVLFGGIQYDAGGENIPGPEQAVLTPTPELPFPYESLLRSANAGKWRPLPGTENEVRLIGGLLRKQGFAAHIFTNAAATEAAFKELGRTEPSPHMLHLATHGYFFPDPAPTVQDKASRFSLPGGQGGAAFKTSLHPMIRSGLILAGANGVWTSGRPPVQGEDGILTAYEISQQNLSQTGLVVLSACESGLGDLAGNEGIYGLQRAFKIAGAKYLIMSLWQVNDNTTSELMAAFYRQYLDLKLPAPQAFRAAQKVMRKKYPKSPFAWAGFVLVE